MSRELDLGVFSGPVLVFGGPYGNLEATRAVLEIAWEAGIPASRILCTGDVCAYCADPLETADLVRQSGIVVVKGNCDENLGNRADGCGCGFGDGTACDTLSRQWYAYADARLDDPARRWMRELPDTVAFRMAGRRFRVIHGGHGQINRFVYRSTPESDKGGDLDAGNCDAILAGHSGLPFTQFIGDRLWHNAGVIGMPANDGTPRTWVSLLTPESGGEIRIEPRALSYDHEAAARKMRARGLPAGYADALETGLWPSLDNLPDVERSETGKALALEPLRWAGKAVVSA